LERRNGALSLPRRIDTEHHACHFARHRSIRLGVQQPQIYDEMLFVIPRHSLGPWHDIGNRRVENWLHGIDLDRDDPTLPQ
jgi:hypothetical protein